MTRIVGRRAFALFLPLAVAASMACGLVYLTGQQILRSGANDPQLRLAEDAAAALDGGSDPAAVIPVDTSVDVAASLAPFLVVYDPAGRVLVTDGVLDGGDPIVPRGVLDHARDASPNIVTWQPRAGVRVATVTVAWTGGTVVAGRSLREVERREDGLLAIAGAAWLAMLVGLAGASLTASLLWPRDPGRGPGREVVP